MALLDRLLKRERHAHSSEALLVESGIAEDISPWDFVELEVVGESYRQDALERIAGPKDQGGKQHPVGVTLRCEPDNDYDENAVRVEVMGQLVGYIGAEEAEQLSPALQRHRGVVEARGVIVGGWRREGSEGSFGCRVWLSNQEAARLGLSVDEMTRMWPPPSDGEVRLSVAPSMSAKTTLATATVGNDEHYQDAITGTRPPGAPDAWPILVTFVLADSNPHSKKPDQCVEVRLAEGGATIGYLTAGMTERQGPKIAKVIANGLLPTAHGLVGQGTKKDITLWRTKVTIAE